MWISEAFAQDAAKPAGSDFLTGILPLILIFVVFWFLLIRPQQKRMKEHKALIAAIKKGDEVMTQGGIVGKVTKASETSPTVEVEIADGVRVQVARGQIAGLWNPTPQPAPGAGQPANDAKPGILKRLFGR
ncbi:MAG TPA: preprotein translocase subunit YajC [Alphaproteobacteria bacterium]|jgi:preprotein translocase subunit YajC